MDHISELGPIDPQWQIPRGDGSVITAPAQAVVDQFEVAKKQITSDPSSMAAWIPILKEYAPAFLVQSQNALDLAEALVTRWLAQYMFAGNPDSETKAKNVASYLILTIISCPTEDVSVWMLFYRKGSRLKILGLIPFFIGWSGVCMWRLVKLSKALERIKFLKIIWGNV